MPRASFRQADLQRIIRAAGNVGATVQIDLRTLVLTVISAADQTPNLLTELAGAELKPDGVETWDD